MNGRNGVGSGRAAPRPIPAVQPPLSDLPSAAGPLTLRQWQLWWLPCQLPARILQDDTARQLCATKPPSLQRPELSALILIGALSPKQQQWSQRQRGPNG